MAWLTSFLLGRPTSEYVFEVNPASIDIDEESLVILQRNLAGDLKKSYLKASVPTVKIASSFLSKTQRDQFASLVGVTDTFLSFQTRDDWTVVNELVTQIDSLHVQIANSSATRLSAALTQLGGASVITIQTPFITALGYPYGVGPFGGGPYGGGSTFDPGAITYTDATRIITLTNPLPSNQSVYVSYTYRGWLVHLDRMSHKGQGGWIDRFQYDFSLTGA